MKKSSSAINCPLCNQPVEEIFLSLDRPVFPFPVDSQEKESMHGRDFHLEDIVLDYYYCQSCALLFSSLIHDERFLRSLDYLYSVHYKNFVTRFESSSEAKPIRHLMDLLSGSIRSMSCGKDCNILEIGCFDGYILYKLKEEGYANSLGVEPNGCASREAKKHGMEVISDFFPPKEKLHRLFDVIFSRFVIEHVVDLKGFLEEMVERSSPDGMIAVEMPNPYHFIAQGNPNLFYPAHTLIPTDLTLANYFSARGFEYVYSKVTENKEGIQALFSKKRLGEEWTKSEEAI